ncbi:MAG: hypothetical protein JSR75_06670 [Proteobacteria bacterium]|nr:hypothetical protein [Pseudomonadota bacterium]
MDPRRIWFDPPHVRWGRVVATVLIASALVGLWVAQRRGLFDEPQNRVVVAAGAADSGVSPRGERNAVPEAAAMVAAAPPAKAASSVELVCGLGAVSFDPDDPKQAERAMNEAIDKLQAHRERVLPGWLEEMKSSADEQVQAGAWFLEAREALAKQAEATNKAEALDSLDELARLAERSRDPLPYALAFQACELFQRVATASACSALRVEAWAERDPGNAFPWLVAASRQGVTAQRRSQYIENAIAAGEMRGTWGALHGVLARAAPANEAPLDRSVRFFEAVSADAVVAVPQSIVVDHCSDNALRQGARRQQCERLAAFLTDKGDSYLFASVGAGIGRRLGWSEDRLARLKAEQESFIGALPPDILGAGCDGLARAEAYFADVARYGERGALRRRQQAER